MPPSPHISLFTVLVRDYDEAIRFYTNALGFLLLEDTDMGAGKRWVRLRPPGKESSAGILLARATTPGQIAAVGNQTGGRVFAFLHTDDIRRDVGAMLAKNVHFRGPPPHIREEAYGTVAVFEDLYGNAWDLIQPPATGARWL